jgi:hypothetical protein
MSRTAPLLLFVLLEACAAATAKDPAREKDRQEIVNHGYGQIYKSASGLKHVNKLLYVKFESDAVENVLDGMSAYCAKLAGDLEELAAKDRQVRIDRTGLPSLTERARDSSNRERLKSLAPIVGSTGKDFERTYLLTQSGALNQLRHLSRVTRAAEKDRERKAFLGKVERDLDEQYRKVVKLLDAEYFRAPAKTWVP